MTAIDRSAASVRTSVSSAMRTPAVITGAGSAFPAGRTQVELWDEFYGPHSGHDKWARRIFLSSGCTTRHVAVDPTREDISGWSTGARMVRYVEEAMPIGESAAATALAAAGMEAADIGLLAVVTCTGYATPGVDIRLADVLGMSDATQRLLIGHMGCYAALPGLGAVSDYVVARGRPALLLCLEVASLHVQPPTGELEQVVAHALFSDGASAVVVEPGAGSEGARSPDPGSARRRPPGMAVVDVMARTDVASADHMTWDITDLGFRMGLSRRVPDVLARHAAPMIGDLLAGNGLDFGDVEHWAVHPGGPRILDVVGEELGLGEGALDPSRRVLAEHGNCSSATVLLVIDEIRRTQRMTPGGYTVAMAFGPGLTLYAALLRAEAGSPEGQKPRRSL